MPDRPACLRAVALVVASALTLPVPARASGVEIEELVVATSIPDVQRDVTIAAARAFYDFWNNGDPAFLRQAIADCFTDRTLPGGRPSSRGSSGPTCRICGSP